MPIEISSYCLDSLCTSKGNIGCLKPHAYSGYPTLKRKESVFWTYHMFINNSRIWQNSFYQNIVWVGGFNWVAFHSNIILNIFSSELSTIYGSLNGYRTVNRWATHHVYVQKGDGSSNLVTMKKTAIHEKTSVNCKRPCRKLNTLK